MNVTRLQRYHACGGKHEEIRPLAIHTATITTPRSWDVPRNVPAQLHGVRSSGAKQGKAVAAAAAAAIKSTANPASSNRCICGPMWDFRLLLDGLAQKLHSAHCSAPPRTRAVLEYLWTESHSRGRH